MTNTIGEDAVLAALKIAGIEIDVAIDNAVRTTTFAVLRTAVKSIQAESMGHTIDIGKGKVHTVSKPGDAPNTDTGRLVSSIQALHERGEQVGFVGTNVEYGRTLEEDMNRPWLKPALDSEEPNMTPRITEEITKKLKQRFG
jgi:hypothetical protein